MLPQLGEITALVKSAGQEELWPRFRKVEREFKQDASVLTEADLAVQQRLQTALTDRWPDVAFLGEEMSEAEQLSALAGSGAVWCLDPLDGTSNYANGIPYFCISLALIESGRVVMGVVYDPVRDECFYGSEDSDVMLNDTPLRLLGSSLQIKQTAAIVDFKRLPADLSCKIVKKPPYGSQRSFGSVALDWCWLAAERGHLYLHGKQKLWDYAAGHYLFTRAGGMSATLQGTEVFTRSLEPRSAVAAVDERLFRDWSEFLNEHAA